MRDGGLSSSGRPIHPEDNGVLIIHTKSQNPIHDFVDNCSSGVGMAFRLIDCVSGVMKCAGSDRFLEMFESTYVTIIRSSVFNIDLTHTYCSAMMVDLKCTSMYDMIGGMRKHDIVLREVDVRKGGCRCFGITPNRIISACGNSEAVLPADFNLSVRELALHVQCQWSSDSGCVPSKTTLSLRYQRLSLLSLSLLTTTTFFFK